MAESPAMLEIRDINAFYGRAHILYDVSLSLRAGEVVALLGRNGAGKSTTMKAIMRLVRCDSGSVHFQGRDVSRFPSHRIARAGLGYVPEDRRIFGDLTILENLEVGRQKPRPDAPHWTVEKLFALFPNLRERAQNLGRNMSGGEQQMLTIARTLMGNPRVVLLDEPSEGIAPVIVEQMAQAIVTLKREGLSVLVSEQNLHFARLVSDRAYIIEKGHVMYEGSFADLEAQPEVRQKYLAL
ncbi:MAG: ABC transporter ATP-binding protein [Sneathiellaceae bacterium]